MARQRFNRTHRVASLLRETVSEVLRGSVKDPRVALATITDVEVTGDLREARIYVHISGDEAERSDVLGALQRAAGFVRHEVGQRVRMRNTPSIEFRYDASIEYGSRIEQQLRALGLGGGGAPEDSEPTADSGATVDSGATMDSRAPADDDRDSDG